MEIGKFNRRLDSVMACRSFDGGDPKFLLLWPSGLDMTLMWELISELSKMRLNFFIKRIPLVLSNRERTTWSQASHPKNIETEHMKLLVMLCVAAPFVCWWCFFLLQKHRGEKSINKLMPSRSVQRYRKNSISSNEWKLLMIKLRRERWSDCCWCFSCDAIIAFELSFLFAQHAFQTAARLLLQLSVYVRILLRFSFSLKCFAWATFKCIEMQKQQNKAEHVDWLRTCKLKSFKDELMLI